MRNHQSQNSMLPKCLETVPTPRISRDLFRSTRSFSRLRRSKKCPHVGWSPPDEQCPSTPQISFIDYPVFAIHYQILYMYWGNFYPLYIYTYIHIKLAQILTFLHRSLRFASCLESCWLHPSALRWCPSSVPPGADQRRHDAGRYAPLLGYDPYHHSSDEK